MEGGYHIDNQRGGALQHIDYAGFVTDHDIHSAEVRATMPCYRDYLTPIGADHGAGTAITGVRNERLVVTIEVFPDAATMQASIPMLDSLRPHIGRAVVLASELQSRECVSAVDALDRVGTGTAFLGSRGQVIAANPSFAEQLGTACSTCTIADGQSVEAIARDTQKSVETVRSHLKRIFSKTSTGRQNELALLLRGFAQPLGA